MKASTEHSADPDLSNLIYSGWVPTANGRLSFRHFGEAKHPEICRYSNISAPSRDRLIIGFQKRDLSDFLFAGITRLFTRNSGVFWFTVACRSGIRQGDMDSLQGSIFIFMPAERDRFGLEKSLSSQIEQMNALRLTSGYSTQIESIYNDAENTLILSGDLKVDFCLWRDGEVLMSPPIFRDMEVAKNSEEYASKRGTSFAKWVSDQAYFFLRDICHVHQHHAPNVDTIMTLQDASGADGNWRNNILYSLHNYIIRVRRSGRSEDLHRAVGVLAYARSFKAVCETRNKADGLSRFNYETIEGSLSAKINENDFLDLQAANIKNWSIADSLGYRNILIAFLGVMTAVFVVIMQPYMMKNASYWESVGKKVWDHAIAIGAIATVVIIVLWIASEESVIRKHIYQKNRFYTRDIAALSILKWKVVGVLALSLSAAVFLTAVYALL